LLREEGLRNTAVFKKFNLMKLIKLEAGIKSGPFRVWLKNQNYPGLAMSRSIGDLVASSIGVTCDPGIILVFDV